MWVPRIQAAKLVVVAGYSVLAVEVDQKPVVEAETGVEAAQKPVVEAEIGVEVEVEAVQRPVVVVVVEAETGVEAAQKPVVEVEIGVVVDQKPVVEAGYSVAVAEVEAAQKPVAVVYMVVVVEYFVSEVGQRLGVAACMVVVVAAAVPEHSLVFQLGLAPVVEPVLEPGLALVLALEPTQG